MKTKNGKRACAPFAVLLFLGAEKLDSAGFGLEAVGDLGHQAAIGGFLAFCGIGIVVTGCLELKGEIREKRDIHAGFGVDERTIESFDLGQGFHGFPERNAIGKSRFPIDAFGESQGGVLIGFADILLDIGHATLNGEAKFVRVDQECADTDGFDEAVTDIGNFVMESADIDIEEKAVEKRFEIGDGLDVVDGCVFGFDAIVFRLCFFPCAIEG